MFIILMYISSIDIKINQFQRIINNTKYSFIIGLDDEEDFSGPPALETIEVQQQQVSNCLIKKRIIK